MIILLFSIRLVLRSTLLFALALSLYLIGSLLRPTEHAPKLAGGSTVLLLLLLGLLRWLVDLALIGDLGGLLLLTLLLLVLAGAGAISRGGGSDDDIVLLLHDLVLVLEAVRRHRRVGLHWRQGRVHALGLRSRRGRSGGGWVGLASHRELE